MQRPKALSHIPCPRCTKAGGIDWAPIALEAAAHRQLVMHSIATTSRTRCLADGVVLHTGRPCSSAFRSRPAGRGSRLGSPRSGPLLFVVLRRPPIPVCCMGGVFTHKTEEVHTAERRWPHGCNSDREALMLLAPDFAQARTSGLGN